MSAAKSESRAAREVTTTSDRVFLRPEVKFEPLISNWYAWSHLLAPVPHALHLTSRQIPLLQSFLASASVHIAAARDSNLFGGPFVDLTDRDRDAVSHLLQQTRLYGARLIRLAEDLKSFERSLEEMAAGASLNPFYEHVPASLKGVAEFAYDRHNRAVLRVVEDLLYDEDLAAQMQQVLLSLAGEQQRPFFMYTPRLPSEQNLVLPMKFSDPRIDALCAARTQASSFSELVTSWNIAEPQKELFRRCFTTRRQESPGRTYTGDGVRIRYFGHACVLVQTREVSILIDPMLAFERNHTDGRFTFDDLPDVIDFVVLTHNHQDHCSPEMLLQLRHRIGSVIVPRSNGDIADPSMKLILKALGFSAIQVVEPFDRVTLPSGRMTSLPFSGEHADLHVDSKQTLLIEIKGRRFMWLVDSDGQNVELYTRIMRKLPGRIDCLFIGMECVGAPLTWLYGPLLAKTISRRDDQSRRLAGADCKRAWAIITHLNPQRVCVYAMGQEPWLRYIMGLEYAADSVQLKEVGQLISRCLQAGLQAERLYIRSELHFD